MFLFFSAPEAFGRIGPSFAGAWGQTNPGLEGPIGCDRSVWEGFFLGDSSWFEGGLHSLFGVGCFIFVQVARQQLQELREGVAKIEIQLEKILKESLVSM